MPIANNLTFLLFVAFLTTLNLLLLCSKNFHRRVAGLMDYPAIIKHPMDLGTILKKIHKKKYSTLYQCGEDVRLVWSNCMLYNADGSDFYKLAENLKRAFDTKYNKLLQDIGAAAAAAALTADSNKVSLQEKRNMAKQLYQITKEDLGKFLIEVEAKCPAAIKRNAAEDELELNIDAISSSAMPALMELLKTYVMDGCMHGWMDAAK